MVDDDLRPRERRREVGGIGKILPRRLQVVRKSVPLEERVEQDLLALLHAEAYHDLFFGEMPVSPVAPFSFRKLAKSQKLVTVALESGVSLHELMKLNPDIRDLRRPLPKGYWLVLPEGTRQSTSLKETLAEFGTGATPT